MLSESAKRLQELLDSGFTTVEEIVNAVVSLQLKGDYSAAQALIDACAELNIPIAG